MTAARRASLWIVLMGVLGALALIATACAADGGDNASESPSASSPPVGSTGEGAGKFVAVAIEEAGFRPATVSVKTGTTVVWTNMDRTQHTVTSTDGPGVDAAPTGAFASLPLDKGGTFQYMFDSPGVYYYECSIHAARAAMHAEVRVTE